MAYARAHPLPRRLAAGLLHLGATALRIVGDDLDNPPEPPEDILYLQFALAIIGMGIVGAAIGMTLAIYTGAIS